MSNFKVGCSPLTSRIFAGNVLKSQMWGNKKYDVTESAPMAVAQYLIQTDQYIEFDHPNGRTYRLQAIEVKNKVK